MKIIMLPIGITFLAGVFLTIKLIERKELRKSGGQSNG